MKILFALTYYRPHVSGLTIYVERLARALVQRGHRVTVLTSRYNRALPAEEVLDGVRVVRAPVLFRFNKGVFMPSFAGAAWREMRNADVVSIHLPQVEAALATAIARAAGRQPVLTYHCDLQMPPAWYGRVVDFATYWDNRAAGALARKVVAYTDDFASHSPFLRRYHGRGDGKLQVILPPVVIPDPTPGGVAALRERAGVREGQRVIGFAARFAYEKGADRLINAIPRIVAEIPDVRILFAGPYGKDVIGESIWDEFQPLIERYRPYLAFLGTLSPEEMADFFALCDVVTVASINNTESFGLVQVEAFMCGTPVVATDLPGVRQPVMMTGMGVIVPVADATGLADGVIKVLKAPEAYIKPRDQIMDTFALDRTVEAYERLFESVRT